MKTPHAETRRVLFIEWHHRPDTDDWRATHPWGEGSYFVAREEESGLWSIADVEYSPRHLRYEVDGAPTLDIATIRLCALMLGHTDPCTPGYMDLIDRVTEACATLQPALKTVDDIQPGAEPNIELCVDQGEGERVEAVAT